jgi:hypothetical protein
MLTQEGIRPQAHAGKDRDAEVCCASYGLEGQLLVPQDICSAHKLFRIAQSLLRLDSTLGRQKWHQDRLRAYQRRLRRAQCGAAGPLPPQCSTPPALQHAPWPVYTGIVRLNRCFLVQAVSIISRPQDAGACHCSGSRGTGMQRATHLELAALRGQRPLPVDQRVQHIGATDDAHMQLAT